MDISTNEQRQRFSAWLRTCRAPTLAADSVELKFNPYHDPANGQFTFGPNGAGNAHGYRGMTARGVGMVRPVSGGGTDREGRPAPEQFALDPYALHTPAEALAHYVAASGEDRNYYFNKIDTSHVVLSDFPEVAKLAAEGKPGVHPIVNAIGSYNGGMFGDVRNTTSAATVGGLVLRANGVLAIERDGNYRFNGRISADSDKYDFNAGQAARRLPRLRPQSDASCQESASSST